MITYSIPGLRFFHQGQLEGRKKRISPHLVRAPEESPDQKILEFYGQLLEILKNPALKCGAWQRLPARPAWEGNESWDAFIAHSWQGTDGERVLVVVNYSSQPGQCYLPMPFYEFQNKPVRLDDLLSSASYDRQGNELIERGLYLDLGPWSYHVFTLKDIE